MKLGERLLHSSVGAKLLVAVTGLMLTGFVLGHLSGNLLIFAGAEKFNAYAAWLHSLGGLLWVARLGLLAAFVLHVSIAIKLTRENRAARPIPYANEATIQASWASRHMIHTGLVILSFVIYHLAHFTFKATNPEFASLTDGDVYGMVVAGFSSPAVSGFYVLAMLALSFHLCHGVSSVFQTVGLNHSNLNPATDKIGPVIATIVFIGFSSIPLAVLAGFVK